MRFFALLRMTLWGLVCCFYCSSAAQSTLHHRSVILNAVKDPDPRQGGDWFGKNDLTDLLSAEVIAVQHGSSGFFALLRMTLWGEVRRKMRFFASLRMT